MSFKEKITVSQPFIVQTFKGIIKESGKPKKSVFKMGSNGLDVMVRIGFDWPGYDSIHKF